jgi:hypothetical protein
MTGSPGATSDPELQGLGIPSRERSRHESRGQKKPARRLAFSCPKAGEELLLRRSGRRSSRSSGGRSSRSSSGSGGRGGSGRRSSRSTGGGSSGRGGSVSSLGGFSGLRSFSSGLRRFDLGRLGRLRGFGLAASGNSQREEGSYEERLVHFGKFLNVMELIGQLVDRNVSISINFLFYHSKLIHGAPQHARKRSAAS